MLRFWVEERAALKANKPARLDLRRVKRLAKAAWDEGERLSAAQDYAGAVRWLGRAHRIAPADQNILFSLAYAHWRTGDMEGAASMFGDLWRRHHSRETACGYLAALHALGRGEDALAVLAETLRETALDDALTALAGRIAPAWCGVTEAGAICVQAQAECTARLDGKPLESLPSSASLHRLVGPVGMAGAVQVRGPAGAILGSPLDLARIFRLEGFVERRGKAVAGWLWYPGAPGRTPRLRVIGSAGNVLAERDADVFATVEAGAAPLARPRAFRIPLPDRQAVSVLDEAGRAVLGSPVPAAGSFQAGISRAASVRALPKRVTPRLSQLETDIIIPVYRGRETTLSCLASVFAAVSPATRIWVVNDASPDPALVAALQALARKRRIRLIPSCASGANRGFPGAANAGLRAAWGRHAVLLNSDTLVAPGWLETLRDAVLSAPDIGTATPLSNDASILSYPDEAGRNKIPTLAAVKRLARLAAAANRGRLIDIPTANGFCMFIRADCLAATGAFDETLFSQGYGEENDFCERAGAQGWRHVAVPEVFVGHAGGQSFGAARMHLLRRNLGLLEQRHPGYHARVAAWIAADTLSAARHALDLARFEAAGTAFAAAAKRRGITGAPRAVVLVTHALGGGTKRFVRERAAHHAAEGIRAIILRASEAGCCVEEADETYPSLRFSLPAQSAALADLLRRAGAAFTEIHHLMGHHRTVPDLLQGLSLPCDIFVHDYAWFCHRLSFVTGEGRFCGEADTAQCVTCVREWGSELGARITPAALRAQSARLFTAARAVYVASEDVARRVRRFVPAASPRLYAWETSAPAAPASPPARRPGGRIAIIGAIGVDKGFNVLLDCARDAVARALPLEFIVIGYTERDEALLETGRVFITGEFKPSEATPLIRAQDANLAFIPSIWPETWCYALSDAWAAGLPAVVFDIGTPPHRVRAARGGWVLPLGLPASRVNEALLSLGLRNNNPVFSPAV